MSARRTVLITGCSDGGIGAALAHAFADRADFHVFATARDVGKMATLTDRAEVTTLQLDVTNDQLITQAVQAVSSETGRLDILVNNAGRTHFMPLLDESISDAKAIFDTNVWGALAMIKSFSPLLIAAKGTVVNITSVSGYMNVPWMGTYAASKRSLEILADTLRLELQPFGVHVINVVTATVKTNGLSYFDGLRLPGDSLYSSIENIIRDRARGSGAENRMNARDYADKVITSLLTARSGTVWGPGFTAGFVKIVTAWLPVSFLVGASFSTLFGWSLSFRGGKSADH